MIERTILIACLPGALGAAVARAGDFPLENLGAGCRERPNLVVVLTDDQGYADLGCQGAVGFRTPHLDRLGAEGLRFTDFHVAQPVCSASRAAILTGCYPNRIGIHGALDHTARHGLHDEETTLAELLREAGYATAVFGKWHLGHHRPFLPLQHGFDRYAGIPYSNDMWPFHPENPNYYPPLPWIEGNEVRETLEDQSQVTERLTELAVEFIRENAERPFFLYLPHPMPHVPLFVSDPFRDRAEQGRYGDVIEEIDASMGRILGTLGECGIDERTWVVFLSDNGPWLSYGDHAGSTGPLREGKGTSWEEGFVFPA